MKRTTFIEFFYPGAHLAETSVKEVESRNYPEELPENAFGFHFYDQYKHTENGIETTSKRLDYSGKTFIGKIITLAELEENPSLDDLTPLVIKRMKQNGLDVIVKARGDIYQQLEQGDRVVDENGQTIYPKPEDPQP